VEDADFSDEFCRFLQAAIPAVDAAELLLLVADRPDVWSTPAELVERLRPKTPMTEDEARRHLEVFAARGLLEAGEEGRVRYKPQGEELARHVRTLAQAYEERPVTLVRVIYALKDAKIRTFADAFRLRKK
jgi:DNA-binding transcriptional ArsR family regulator